MPLDAQAQVVVDFIESTTLMTLEEDTDPVTLRAQTSFAFPSPVELPGIEDLAIPGPAGEIPVRVYRPDVAGTHPVVVFFHGGGFVMGGLDTHDDLCRRITAGTPCIVVSVDYRLAPEHPFPAGVDDCVAAVQWAADHAAEFDGDPTRLAVAGDSAGGNLAAVVTQIARDAGGPPIAYQLLIYPIVTHTFDQPSIDENRVGMLLTVDAMEWFRRHYVPDPATWTDPRNSPLCARDFAGLPAAHILTAECDPLRDQGRLYAESLRAAGVDVEYREHAGQFHGFLLMFDAIDAAGPALADALAGLRTACAEGAD